MITQQKFQSEMRRADALRKNNDDVFQSEYWAGYMRGLRRAYHGEKFGTEDEHNAWMNSVDSQDERRKQIGQGYRDGFTFPERSKAASTLGKLGGSAKTPKKSASSRANGAKGGRLIKIQADTTNGIYKVKDFDQNFDELTSENILESSLKDLADGEMIYSKVSPAMYKKLDATYGIK